MQGKEPVKQIFGWATDAASDEYREFLEAFLPGLMEFIDGHQLRGRCYFHVSDEPSRQHIPAYLYAKKLLESQIDGLPIMDALSDYEFYAQGLVGVPVCSNNHIEPFLENKVPGLWTYYCCGQYQEVSNRFFCMPSQRNRILGIQLYKFNIRGFCSGALISGCIRFPATALILTALPTLPAHFLPAMPSLFIPARTARWLPYGLRC